MQKTTSKNGWAVFTVVAVVALGGTIAGAGIGRGAEHGFAERRDALLVDCRGSVEARTGEDADWSPSPVACPPPSTPFSALSEYRLGAGELEAVPTASRLGFSGQASRNLVKVLERADHIDRARTMAASLLSAKLFDGVSDRVEADPALLDDPRLVAAIRKSGFYSARRPLESERLHALTVLSGVPGQVPIRTSGLVEWKTTQAMDDVNVALRGMEAGALAGDLKACEAAAAQPQGLAKQVTIGASICKSASRIVESANRLHRLQARAAAHSPRPNTRTARSAPITL